MNKKNYILISTILLAGGFIYGYWNYYTDDPRLSGLLGNLAAGSIAALIAEGAYFVYKKTNGRK